MYTKDILLSCKYGELLKIAKTLDIKRGRQKTDKLIQLILKAQERNDKYEPSLQLDPIHGEDITVAIASDGGLLHSDNEELLEDIEFPENSFSQDSPTEVISGVSSKKSYQPQEKVSKSSMLRSKGSGIMQKRNFYKSVNTDATHSCAINDNIKDLNPDLKVIENKKDIVLDEYDSNKCVSTNLSDHNLKDHEEEGKSLRRSGTFKLTDDEKVKRRSLKRSGTFKLRSSLNSKSTKGESEKIHFIENVSSDAVKSSEGITTLNNDLKQSSILSDLYCGEVNEKKAHRRSGTYIISENKRKRSRDSSSANEVDDISSMPVRKRRSFVVPTMGQPSPVVMDLTCNEVQTVKDIQYIEDNNAIESPFQSINASRSRVRRSLRSHLLDSRLSVHQRLSILSGANSPANRSVMSLQEEKEDCPETHECEKLVPESSTQCNTPQPIFNIVKKDNQPSEEVQSNKIPRFVAYAKKIKSKLPNFNKIHEKAFSKMEPLDEYVERKQHIRTRSRNVSDCLSSVKKVTKQSDVFKPTVTRTVDLKLKFTDVKTASLFGNKAQKKSRSSISNSPAVVNKPSLGGSTKNHLKASNEYEEINSNSVKKSAVLSKVKVNALANDTTNENNHRIQSTPQKAKFVHPTSIPRLIKENMPPVIASSPWNVVKKDPILTPGSHMRRKSYNPKIVNDPEKPSYRPYKGAIRPIGNREVFKKMAEKNPKVKSRFDMRKEQKVFIKGVRTNKRFELQMAKRGIKL